MFPSNAICSVSESWLGCCCNASLVSLIVVCVDFIDPQIPFTVFAKNANGVAVSPVIGTTAADAIAPTALPTISDCKLLFCSITESPIA